MNSLSQIAVLRGIFLKRESEQYHFVFPNIYDKKLSQHTYKTLADFDIKVENHYLSQDIVLIEASGIKIHKPIYKDRNIQANGLTHFRCKSIKKYEMIVGQEYILDVELKSGKFIEKDIVIYWSINIKNIR